MRVLLVLWPHCARAVAIVAALRAAIITWPCRALLLRGRLAQLLRGSIVCVIDCVL